MHSRVSRLMLAAAIVAAGIAPAVAQPNPMDPDMWRRQPTCVDSYYVPQVLTSRGYRNARVIDQIDTEHVKVIAENSQGKYLIVFNLCRAEIEDREAL